MRLSVGETERIEWPAVDLDAARIMLPEGETKNDESCILPLSDSLVGLLSRVKRREGRVFPSKRAMQAAFPKACKAARIEGLMVHDLRRSAVRNLMNAGVQQAVAVKISGHRDASVFQRYNVVDTKQTTMRCNAYNVSRPSRFVAHCLRGQLVVVGVGRESHGGSLVGVTSRVALK